MTRKVATSLATLVVVLAVTGCAVASEQIPSLAPDVALECGPILDRASCVRAAELAATVKLNPPPLVSVSVRRPGPSDPCAGWSQACGADAVIVQLQSGDTIQSVPLVPSAGGWALLREPDA